METLTFYTEENITLRAGVNSRDRLLKLIKQMKLTFKSEAVEYDTLVDYSKQENPVKAFMSQLNNTY